jgi:hypothetical protein
MLTLRSGPLLEVRDDKDIASSLGDSTSFLSVQFRSAAPPAIFPWSCSGMWFEGPGTPRLCSGLSNELREDEVLRLSKVKRRMGFRLFPSPLGAMDEVSGLGCLAAALHSAGQLSYLVHKLPTNISQHNLTTFPEPDASEFMA